MASETMPRIFIGLFGPQFAKGPTFIFQNKSPDCPVHMARGHLSESLWDLMSP